MTGKKTGFTGKAHIEKQNDSGTYYRILIPVDTVRSHSFRKGDLVKVELRNMEGRTVEAVRNLQPASGDQLRIYLPKKISDKLQVSEGDLLDVFIQRQD